MSSSPAPSTAPQDSVVTLQMIATKAGVAKSSVSYALNNHPKIPKATREHIQRVARELGYRPNPRVASLMAHIRRAHSGGHAERIAFVWVHTSREEARQKPYLQETLRGAAERAEQLGFKLEQFFTDDPDMTDKRLEQILRTRGIIGVVLSPVITAESVIHLDWDWRHFAAAAIGNMEWIPQLHHSGGHHFLSMRTVLLELTKLGCRRPAALLETFTNERAKQVLAGAFLVHHPAPADARDLLRVQTYDEELDAGRWLDGTRADAFICNNEFLRRGGIYEAARKRRLPIASLEWRPKDTPRGVGGIVTQWNDRVAANAVDLVVSQLHSNKTGAPDMPCMMLAPGQWVHPENRRRRKKNGIDPCK